MAKTGIVKWFNDQLGYGFIQIDDGEDLFVHYSAIQGDDTLTEGERVEFEIEAGPRGPMAVRVVRLP